MLMIELFIVVQTLLSWSAFDTIYLFHLKLVLNADKTKGKLLLNKTKVQQSSLITPTQGTPNESVASYKDLGISSDENPLSPILNIF